MRNIIESMATGACAFVLVGLAITSGVSLLYDFVRHISPMLAMVTTAAVIGAIAGLVSAVRER